MSSLKKAYREAFLQKRDAHTAYQNYYDTYGFYLYVHMRDDGQKKSVVIFVYGNECGMFVVRLHFIRSGNKYFFSTCFG